MSAVVTAAGCDILMDCDALAVSPRSAPDPFQVVERQGGTEADIVLAQSAPDAERRSGVGVERSEPRRAETIIPVDVRKYRTVLGEDESQDYRRVHLVEHEVTYDDVGRPLARCRDAAEAVSRDAVHELRKGAKALAEYRELLIPILCHRALPLGHNNTLPCYGHGRSDARRLKSTRRHRRCHSACVTPSWPR